MSVSYAIINNQINVDNFALKKRPSYKDSSGTIFESWDIIYTYPDETQKKFMFVTDEMRLLDYGHSGNNIIFAAKNNETMFQSGMKNMIDAITGIIKKHMISHYGDQISFESRMHPDKLHIVTSKIGDKIITPVIIQRTSKKGGDKIQIKNLSQFDTLKKLAEEIYKYKPRKDEQKKDIYHECKCILGINLLVVTNNLNSGMSKKYCHIKFVAQRVDIKYNTTKSEMSIDTDLTVLTPQADIVKKIEI